jgi:HAD superfamily hydrolase (TIGR01509 family)
MAQPYDPRPVDVEAVTIDAYGTLVELRDPVPPLQAALARRGVERTDAQVRAAFAAEVAFYVVRSYEGRDAATLAALRRACTAVFLEAADAPVDPDEFVPAFVDSISFEELRGAAESLRDLAAAGLRLAVVSNWDIGLHDHLAALGLDRLVDTIVTSAEAGAPKPELPVFELALARLGADPARTVHIGDSPADAEGAHAAGMRFEPAPLADAAARILR